MCAVSLTVRPNELEQYENPERIFRQLRMRRIKPVSGIGVLFPSKAIESNDIRDDHFLDISYDKDMTFIRISYPVQAADEQGSASIFAALGQAGIPFIMVSVQPGQVSFAVGESWLKKVCDCLGQRKLCPEVFADCVKITVRGNGGQPLFATIMALLELLAIRNIPVLRMSESYGLIEILTEGRYIGQLQQAIEKKFLVKY